MKNNSISIIKILGAVVLAIFLTGTGCPNANESPPPVPPEPPPPPPSYTDTINNAPLAAIFSCQVTSGNTGQYSFEGSSSETAVFAATNPLALPGGTAIRCISESHGPTGIVKTSWDFFEPRESSGPIGKSMDELCPPAGSSSQREITCTLPSDINGAYSIRLTIFDKDPGNSTFNQETNQKSAIFKYIIVNLTPAPSPAPDKKEDSETETRNETYTPPAVDVLAANFDICRAENDCPADPVFAPGDIILYKAAASKGEDHNLNHFSFAWDFLNDGNYETNIYCTTPAADLCVVRASVHGSGPGTLCPLPYPQQCFSDPPEVNKARFTAPGAEVETTFETKLQVRKISDGSLETKEVTKRFTVRPE